MTAKERAKELVAKYMTGNGAVWSLKTSKKCAIICVDEIDAHIVRSTPKDDIWANLSAHEYWSDVKAEIEKL